MSRLVHLLNRDATISRITRSTDGQGGWAESFTPQFTSKVRVSGLSFRERSQGAAELAEVSHAIYFESTKDVRRDDRILVGTTNYDVLSVQSPSVSGVYLRANVKEEQRGA